MDELLVSGTGEKESDVTLLEELDAALLRSGTVEELDVALLRSGTVKELGAAFKRSGTDNKELYISTPPLKQRLFNINHVFLKIVIFFYRYIMYYRK